MPGIADAIRRHGVDTYPNECCGALIGADGVVEHVSPLPNTTEEGARRRFLIRPSDYKFVEEEATRLGQELLGFYHSHPDHPARPSQYDLDHALPVWSYIIASVLKGKVDDIASWEMENDRSRFNEEPLEIVELSASSEFSVASSQ